MGMNHVARARLCVVRLLQLAASNDDGKIYYAIGKIDK